MQVCMHLRLRNSGALQMLPNPASKHVKLKLTTLKRLTSHAIPDVFDTVVILESHMTGSAGHFHCSPGDTQAV